MSFGVGCPISGGYIQPHPFCETVMFKGGFVSSAVIRRICHHVQNSGYLHNE
ncbi:hypothetical protein CDAR_369731, partial [Caerostris darwini]